LIIQDLPEKQEDEIIEKIGPTKEVAYKDGQLSKAGQGFLKGCGCTEADIYFIDTDKGKKIAIKKQNRGKLTTDILAATTKEVLAGISFPKSMRWNDETTYFARPVRWLILLWNSTVLPFEWNGIAASNFSFGNRILGLEKKVVIPSVSAYEKKLEEHFVIANRDRRLQMIEHLLDTFYQKEDIEVVKVEGLVSTVTDLVEFPTIIEGTYDSRFLKLPEKVITGALSEHQKYFSVKRKDEDLLVNKFLFISNGAQQFASIICKGNEKVITARLSDAEFYFLEDTKHKLEHFVPKLSDVLFEASLGNLLEKTERLISLVSYIADILPDISAMEKDHAIRAAKLAKADLVTHMLGEKEFTKLQGYIGKIYAGLSGEPIEVSEAIFEHYLPRGKDDELPLSRIGAIVAIADKLDTVCGIIGIGRLPTGSNDPFALRRAAAGIIQILYAHHLPLELDSLVQKSFSLYCEKFEQKKEFYDFTVDFFKQRIIWFLQQQKIEADVIKSVMHIDFYSVTDAIQRAQDLQSYKMRDDFQKLVTGFKRVANIIEQEKEIPKINEQLLVEKEEKDLFLEMKNLSKQVTTLLSEKKYQLLMEKLVAFSYYIDQFFDHVLVNTDHREICLNRYGLLAEIRSIFLKVADLTQIIVEEKK
jgi:glycyl-tRNA synthetase beta chain